MRKSVECRMRNAELWNDFLIFSKTPHSTLCILHLQAATLCKSVECRMLNAELWNDFNYSKTPHSTLCTLHFLCVANTHFFNLCGDGCRIITSPTKGIEENIKARSTTKPYTSAPPRITFYRRRATLPPLKSPL